MRNIIEIKDLSTDRLETAIQYLRHGDVISYKNIGIFIHHNIVFVSVQAHFKSARIKKKSALNKLDDAKSAINKIFKIRNDFSDLLQQKKIRYVLFDDYGTSSMRICEEIDGKINWIIRSKN